MVGPNIEPSNLAPEKIPPYRSKHDLRELLRLVWYIMLAAALIGAVVYFFIWVRNNQRRVANLYLTRAKQLMKQDQINAAADELKKAGLTDPKSLEIQREQLKVQIFQIANESDSLARPLNFEKLDKAETDCKFLLSQDPGSAELTALLGILYAHKDQPGLAMETYERAAKMDPTYPNVLNFWGNSASQWRYPENWQELAARKFKEATQLNPKYITPRVSLGWIEVANGNFEGAVRIFSDAEEIGKSKAVLYAYWGITLDEWGRKLQESSNNLEAYKKFAEALEKYRLAEALDPNDALLHFNKANALGDGLNRPDDAMVEYKRALKLEPGLPWAHAGIALILLNRKDSRPQDLEEALSHLNEAISLTAKTIGQFQYRKTRTTDAHAHKMLDRWIDAAVKRDIFTFKTMTEDVRRKVSGTAKSDRGKER